MRINKIGMLGAGLAASVCLLAWFSFQREASEDKSGRTDKVSRPATRSSGPLSSGSERPHENRADKILTNALLDGEFSRLGEIITSLALESDHDRWLNGLSEIAEILKRRKGPRSTVAWATYCAALRGLSTDAIYERLASDSDKIIGWFEGAQSIDGTPALRQLTALLVDRFSVQDLRDDLSAKLKSAPLAFRQLVFTASTASDVAAEYPGSLKAMDTLQADLLPSIEREVIQNLTNTQREQALDFVLHHAKSIDLECPEVARIFNDAWFFENSEVVTATIRDAPRSPARDILISEIVRALETSLPQDALAWAKEISDTKLRENVIGRFENRGKEGERFAQ